ncbi:hypothetical protein ACPOL_5725 [Acidisarcina polymorpha]|uniref:Helix-hairpin-helix domain-containing protein n=1 Tax=Acidisarcina polymorpha TaxID=2211140 RepID=A0A2Z5G7B7_9BACT|nr:helix-hairpin-helix domain-containing protein [Acidisarcina polymorpha]AXC14971.1 hypothetical protein ACPOL_5725 [Acidisarcina polymorpha]
MSTARQAVEKSPVVAAILLAATSLAGCSSAPSNQQIQQQAAETTQQVKQGTEKAAADARVAAANAEDKINAVAAGVRQGLQGSGPALPPVDLNNATRDQLVALPGISPAKARKILAGRPYSAPNELVSRGILTQDQFDRISKRLTARPPTS